MEKLPKYFLSLFIVVLYTNLHAQVNCNVIEGENCKKACEIYNDSGIQGSKESQENFDKAITLCPSFSDAYMEKSVPYLKRGDFLTWKIWIDKAVELNPKMHLGYRGWCRYQFLRDYNGAIADIEALEKIYPTGYLGYSANGDYELHIAKALCYSAIGQKEKAISIIENQLSKKDHNVGLYDHYQLGVTYFETGKYDKALENFEKQSKVDDFAENIYFRSKVSKVRNKDYLDLKTLALKTYDEGKTMKDGYTHHFNKVYRTQMAEL